MHYRSVTRLPRTPRKSGEDARLRRTDYDDDLAAAAGTTKRRFRPPIRATSEVHARAYVCTRQEPYKAIAALAG